MKNIQKTLEALALTVLICKIFEKITNKRMIVNRQFDFRKKRSIIDAIYKISTKFLDEGKKLL